MSAAPPSSTSSTWLSWIPGFGSSSSTTGNGEAIKQAQTNLDTVKTECDKKIQEATNELDKVKSLNAGTPVVGGRRRRKTASKKSSGKRKTVRKSSMFNIKWPKL